MLSGGAILPGNPWYRAIPMSRIYRLLLCLIVLGSLVACGNKGDLIKPSAPDASAKAASFGR